LKKIRRTAWLSRKGGGTVILPFGRSNSLFCLAHYFSHRAWLEEGALLRDVNRLAGIPGVLFHGRLDLGSPLQTAWELAGAWPDAQLVVIADSGHTGSQTMRKEIHDTLERFAGS
jgi:proline iminopeptidase